MLPIGSKSTLLRLESSLASDSGGGPGAPDLVIFPPPSSGLLPPDTDLHFKPLTAPLLNELPPRLDFDLPL